MLMQLCNIKFFYMPLVRLIVVQEQLRCKNVCICWISISKNGLPLHGTGKFMSFKGINLCMNYMESKPYLRMFYIFYKLK